jgi:hypothetical protein
LTFASSLVRERRPTTTQIATRAIAMDTSLSFDGMCPGVFAGLSHL